MPPQEKDHVNLAKAVKALAESMPAQLELVQLQAKIMRARYDALLAHGFTKEEALALCPTPFKF